MALNQKTIDDVAPTLPKELQEPFLWLWGYMAQMCDNSRNRLAARLAQVGHPYDSSYIYKFFSGQLLNPKTGKIGDKQLRNWIDAIQALRDAEKGPLNGRGIPPVETEVVRMLRDAIDAVRRPERVCRWLAISGDTGRQKSYGLGWYRSENNHGSTIMFEAPERPCPGYLAAEMSNAICKVSCKAYYERIANIRSNLNASKCLIIDNAQRLYNPNTGDRQDSFSLIQKLQDEIGFSVVFVFVRNVWSDGARTVKVDFIEEMLHGKARGFFSQFIGRIGGAENILYLPDETSDTDLVAFAAAVGMTAADAKLCLPLLRHLDRSTGNIRVLLQNLQNAADLAHMRGQKSVRPGDLCDVVSTDKLDSDSRSRLGNIMDRIRDQEAK
jgi:hypothetical protein